MKQARAPRPRARLRDYPGRFLELAGPIGVGLAMALGCFLGFGVYLNEDLPAALFSAAATFFLFATLAIVVRWLWAALRALLAPRAPPDPGPPPDQPSRA
jgi:hypothetical protein